MHESVESQVRAEIAATSLGPARARAVGGGAAAADVTRAVRLGPVRFAALALVVGVATGLGAYAFRALIALVHNAAFLGQVSLAYDSNAHTPPGPRGLGIALVPAVGAVLVASLVRRFAPEAKGHGVPEVMDAIYYHCSVIRPKVALVKSLASALSIGTGGSVGREGPIIQIGASLASSVGGLLHVSRWQLATLVAAGGGAGIAATFNTPIGGVLFAVEVLMQEVSVRTLVPVAVATASATFVGRSLFGDAPAFPLTTIPKATAGAWIMLPLSIALGVVMALVSILFIRTLYLSEDLFERLIPKRDVLRHVLGMLLVGGLISALYAFGGHYYVEGVGYATVMDVLGGSLRSIGMLMLLALLKLLATCVTLGSGASGGVFSPSLFMGATMGAAFGCALRVAFPELAIEPSVFALAGMAAVVAGTTGAALTAVVMLFEMTLDYNVILPLTLSAAVSYGVRRMLSPESIYTLKLIRRGHVMPGALLANAHLMQRVRDIASTAIEAVAADMPPQKLNGDGTTPYLAIVREGAITGVLSRVWMSANPTAVERAKDLDEIASHDVITVSPQMTTFELIAEMYRAKASAAVVLAGADSVPHEGGAPALAGLITQAQLVAALAEGMQTFAD